MKSALMSFNNNSNIGLYAFVNDKVLLVGHEVPEQYDKDLKEIFQVPLKRITMAGTSLIGVFAAGTNEKLLVPAIILKEELDILKEIMKEVDMTIEVVETKQTCLGNNIAIGKDKILVNSEFTEPQARRLGESLGMEAVRTRTDDTKTIGSLIVVNKDKGRGLIGNDISDDEFEEIAGEIGYELTPSSINMGSPYLKSGILCNKNGFVIGRLSGGPEITNAEEGLGYLD